MRRFMVYSTNHQDLQAGIETLVKQFETDSLFKKYAKQIKNIYGSPTEVNGQLRERLAEIPPDELRKRPTLVKALREFLGKNPAASEQVDFENHPVHLLLLQAECPVLAEALSWGGDRKEIIPAPLIDSVHKFIEKGELAVSSENVWALLELVHHYEMLSLEEACRSFIFKEGLSQVTDLASLSSLAQSRKMAWLLLLLLDEYKKRKLPLPPPLVAFETLKGLTVNAKKEVFATVKSLEELQTLINHPAREYITGLKVVSNNPKIVESLCQNIPHFILLKELDLQNCKIADAEAALLAQGLKSNPSLKKVNLKENQIGDAGAEKLAEAIATHSSLEEIILANNRIGKRGAAKLAEALRVNTTLQLVNLELNRLEAEGAANLAAALKFNTSLLELNLGGNKIGKEGAFKIAEALKENSSLKAINLSGNLIGSEGIAKLIDALRDNRSLQAMDLHYNQAKLEGVHKLDEVLSLNSTLEELNLKENQLGDAGLAKVAGGLKSNASLLSLNLELNGITPIGITPLADALQANTGLQKLNLNANQTGDLGAEKLAEALLSNSSLKEVDLGKNRISGVGKAHLSRVPPSCKIKF